MPKDSISKLQALSWKGLKLPYSSADIGFAHAQSEKKYTFRDQQLIQRLGVQNATYRYSIPFYDGLNGYGDLFTESFGDFYDACLAREPDTLIDPLRGEIRAVVATLQVQLQPDQARDGVLVTVEFVEAPEEIKEYSDPGSSLARAAQKAEEARQGIDGLPPDPEFTDPLVNPIDAVTGVGQQVSLQRDKFHAQIDRETARVDRLIKANDDATDPDKYDAHERLADYKLALRRARNAPVDSTKRIVKVTLEAPKTLMALAHSHGMTVEEFLGLNQEHSDSPVIQAGSTYEKYERNERNGSTERADKAETV